MSVDRTIIKSGEIITPALTANSAIIDKMISLNAENIQSSNAYIENLTIKTLEILDEENGNSNESETFEDAKFQEVNLNFSDENNCKYVRANESNLESDVDVKLLNINFLVPSKIGSKLVCRYLVLDLRNEDVETDIGVIWNNFSITWLYGVPEIKAGFFYVLAFQRFSDDLIIGNVAIKL